MRGRGDSEWEGHSERRDEGKVRGVNEGEEGMMEWAIGKDWLSEGKG